MTNDQTSKPHIFIVFNPVAGTHTPDVVKRLVAEQCQQAGYTYTLYETTGEEDIAAVVRDGLHQQPALVVAAGGDGTVAAVASGMQQSTTPLAILPVGTVNLLARELGIPLQLEPACRLFFNDHTTTALDAMQIGDQRFFLQIGFGLDSLTVRDTSRARKRRFGRLGYLWSALRWLFGHQPVRFTLVVDGQRYRPRAAQISVVNGGSFGIAHLRWAPDIHPDDGQVEVCIVKARTLMDYLLTLKQIALGQQRVGRRIQYIPARQRIIIQADTNLPAQADGELIEAMPMQINVVPGAIQMLVPAPIAETIETGPRPAC